MNISNLLLPMHRKACESAFKPFGLTNAPGVFQQLMERVLAGLNPSDGPSFVVVYIDDVLVFSRTLEEHLQPSRGHPKN